VDTRMASPEDAEAIRTIYNHEVEYSAVTFDLRPRSLDEQRAWLRDRSGAHSVVVAEVDGRVAGFASLSPFRTKPAYKTSVENSIYVAESHRGEGIGDVLLGELCDLADRHGFHAMFARIVDANGASIALHLKHDFFDVGTEVQVGRKFGRWLDVKVMQRLTPV